MPVLKKKGALFPVYHDSPDKFPPSPSTHKKDVLSGRSPTTRSKTKAASGIKAGMGSVRPSAAAVAASAALQAHTGPAPLGGPRKAFGLVGGGGARAANTLGAPKASAGVKELDKENRRAVSVGKVSGKMQVFQDEEETGKPAEEKPRLRRALGSKPVSDVQPSFTTTATARHSKAPRILPTAALTVFRDPPQDPPRGQENIPPPGADPEYNRSPALRRSTRKTTAGSSSHPWPAASSARHDSGVEDPESPYIAKPRLRKLKSTQPMESPRAAHTLVSSSQPQSLVLLATSHPDSEAHQPLDSSPLITRPQTRKPAHTASTKHRPAARHPSAYSVPADPILCDVSEAYGADPSAQPLGFEFASGGTAVKGGAAARGVGVRGDGESAREGRRTGLRPSAYGWTQISAGEYRAPRPPAPRMTRQSRSKW